MQWKMQQKKGLNNGQKNATCKQAFNTDVLLMQAM